MSNDPTPPTVESVLPPRVRGIVYAVLGVLSPVLTTASVLLADGFHASDIAPIVGSIVVGAGFGMAWSNTPTG